MGRHVIEHHRICRADPGRVHGLFADSENWPSWSPIQKVTIEQPARSDGTGEVRVFRTGPFATREEVLANDPPGEYSDRLLSGVPVDNYRSDLTIAGRNDGCEVTWHSEFDPRWPGSGAINRAILSRFVHLILRRLIKTAEASSQHIG